MTVENTEGSGPTVESFVLHCPRCGAQHIDDGEWATKPHRTHLCLNCTFLWRPFPFHTRGVATDAQKATDDRRK